MNLIRHDVVANFDAVIPLTPTSSPEISPEEQFLGKAPSDPGVLAANVNAAALAALPAEDVDMTPVPVRAPLSDALQKQYDAMASRFTCDDDDVAVLNGVRTAVPYSTLKEVIHDVAKMHFQRCDALFKKGIHFSKDWGTKRFIAKVENDEVHIIMYSPHAKLGAGTFSQVYKVFSISHGCFKALKLSHKNEKAQQDVRNEIAHLKQFKILNGGVTPEGIQKEPEATLDLVLDNDAVCGYIGPLYDGDLFDWLQRKDLSQEQRVDCCKQIMAGCRFLIRANMRHGDIKPDNIYIHGQKFLLGDWGATHQMLPEERYGEETLFNFTFTHQYTNEVDFEKQRKAKSNRKDLDLAISQGSLSKRKQNLEEIKRKQDGNVKNFYEACINHEVYSVGTTLFGVLSKGHSPYHVNPFPQFGEDFDGKLIAGYSQKTINLVKKMLSHKAEDRISLKDACDEWEKIGPVDAKGEPAPAANADSKDH